MATSAQVSVVIPTRNRWSLLAGTIRSALAQEDVELELVVVDDGSTDETPRRLADLREPRLRVLRNDKSLGVARARNRGIASATGEWVAFLDHDDLWSPRKLRAQLDAAAASGAVWAYGGGVLVDEDGAVLSVQVPPPAGEVEHELLRLNAIPCGGSNVVARTEVVRELGGFDEALGNSEDWDMWLALSGAGGAAAVPEPLVAFLVHPAGRQLRSRVDVWPDVEYLALKYRHRGFRPDGVQISRYLAGVHRRAGDWRGAFGAYLHGARRYRSAGNLLRAGALLLGEPGRRVAGARRSVEFPPPQWLTDQLAGTPVPTGQATPVPPRPQ